MNKFRIYLFALIFGIAALLFTSLLSFISQNVPGRVYFDPIWQLPLFGPATASVIFIMLSKKDKFSDIGLNRFNFRPLLIVVLIYAISILIERVIQYQFGYLTFKQTADSTWFFNNEFSPLYGSIVFSLLTILFSGLGEELGWRGYLFYKLRNFSWLEMVLTVNIVWAFWHLPMFLNGYMGNGNVLLKFPLFIISCIEFGTLLLYVRLKTKSVISAMLLHPCANIFNGAIAMNYFDVQNTTLAGWPNVISVLVLLPISAYFYIKGKELHDKKNTSEILL